MLVLLGLALPIGVAEVFLRVSGRGEIQPVMFVPDDETVWRLKPNARERSISGRRYDYRWTTSEQQFRAAREYGVPKPRGVVRVLSVGDSFTFGVGVDDSSAYPTRLERLLTDACGHEFEVVNAGVGGFGTSHALRLFEHYGAPLEPDVVVLGWLTSDRIDDQRARLFHVVGDSLQPGAGGREEFWGSHSVADSRLYRALVARSAFVNWLRKSVAAAQLALSAPPNEHSRTESATAQSRHPGARDEIAGWELSRHLLARFQRAVEVARAKFLVLIVPLQRETVAAMRQDSTGTAELQLAEAICRDIGLDCINFATWLVRSHPAQDPDALYIRDEGHMTRLGYHLLAQSVFEHLAAASTLKAVSDHPPERATECEVRDVYTLSASLRDGRNRR